MVTGGASGIGAAPVMADVSVEAGVRALVQRAREQHGRIDIYYSNAGVAFGGGPEAPDDAWQRSWADYDRWIGGMQRLRQQLDAELTKTPNS